MHSGRFKADDPRLQPGAYISGGGELFYQYGRGKGTHYTLEDCARDIGDERLLSIPGEKITKDFKLERAASDSPL